MVQREGGRGGQGAPTSLHPTNTQGTMPTSPSLCCAWWCALYYCTARLQGGGRCSRLLHRLFAC